MRGSNNNKYSRVCLTEGIEGRVNDKECDLDPELRRTIRDLLDGNR